MTPKSPLFNRSELRQQRALSRPIILYVSRSPVAQSCLFIMRTTPFVAWHRAHDISLIDNVFGNVACGQGDHTSRFKQELSRFKLSVPVSQGFLSRRPNVSFCECDAIKRPVFVVTAPAHCKIWRIFPRMRVAMTARWFWRNSGYSKQHFDASPESRADWGSERLVQSHSSIVRKSYRQNLEGTHSAIYCSRLDDAFDPHSKTYRSFIPHKKNSV